jgi:hypothetical protein
MIENLPLPVGSKFAVISWDWKGHRDSKDVKRCHAVGLPCGQSISDAANYSDAFIEIWTATPIEEEDADVLFEAHGECQYGDDTLLEVIEGPLSYYEITDKPYSERHPK